MESEPNQPSDAATTVDHSSEASIEPRQPRQPRQLQPLVIDPPLLESVIAHLRAWLPNEGCGLLAALPEEESDRAVHFFPGTNVDCSPVRFTMDPAEVIAAMKRIRDESWQLAAIVHSHPRTQPVPSRTDRREWYYPEARLLIVSFAGAEPQVGCWALAGDRASREFRESQLVHTER